MDLTTSILIAIVSIFSIVSIIAIILSTMSFLKCNENIAVVNNIHVRVATGKKFSTTDSLCDSVNLKKGDLVLMLHDNKQAIYRFIDVGNYEVEFFDFKEGTLIIANEGLLSGVEWLITSSALTDENIPQSRLDGNITTDGCHLKIRPNVTEDLTRQWVTNMKADINNNSELILYLKKSTDGLISSLDKHHLKILSKSVWHLQKLSREGNSIHSFGDGWFPRQFDMSTTAGVNISLLDGGTTIQIINNETYEAKYNVSASCFAKNIGLTEIRWKSVDGISDIITSPVLCSDKNNVNISLFGKFTIEALSKKSFNLQQYSSVKEFVFGGLGFAGDHINVFVDIVITQLV
jgi:hypothetical protein